MARASDGEAKWLDMTYEIGRGQIGPWWFLAEVCVALESDFSLTRNDLRTYHLHLRCSVWETCINKDKFLLYTRERSDTAGRQASITVDYICNKDITIFTSLLQASLQGIWETKTDHSRGLYSTWLGWNF